MIALVAENALATTYLQSRVEYSDATSIITERVHSTVEYALAVVLGDIGTGLMSCKTTPNRVVARAESTRFARVHRASLSDSLQLKPVR